VKKAVYCRKMSIRRSCLEHTAPAPPPPNCPSDLGAVSSSSSPHPREEINLFKEKRKGRKRSFQIILLY